MIDIEEIQENIEFSLDCLKELQECVLGHLTESELEENDSEEKQLIDEINVYLVDILNSLE